MKTIASEFTFDSYHFKQLIRSGQFCIYSKTKPSHQMPSFEVVKIFTCAPTKFPNGDCYPAREVYPSSNDWGTYGWTYTTFHDATQKLNLLTNNNAN